MLNERQLHGRHEAVGERVDVVPNSPAFPLSYPTQQLHVSYASGASRISSSPMGLPASAFVME